MSGRRRGRPAKGTKQNGASKANTVLDTESEQTNQGRQEEIPVELGKFPEMETIYTGNASAEKGKAINREVPDEEEAIAAGGSHKGTTTPPPKWYDQVEQEERNLAIVNGTGSCSREQQGAKTWAQIVQGEEGFINYAPPGEVEGIKMGELNLNEVEESKSYWGNVLVCKVIGSFPPFMVMNGMLNRIWRNRGLEKVWQMDRGVFMARFKEKEEMEAICRKGGIQIDGKPVLTLPWSENLNVNEIEIPTVPVWIQLPKLELKYWTPSLIGKIMSSIGKQLKVDAATLNKERLQYARVIIEVDLNSSHKKKEKNQTEEKRRDNQPQARGST